MKKITFFLLFLTLALVTSAQFTITGKITDANNEPLIGASIQIKNRQNATVADVNGEFQLQVKKAGELSLLVSFLGYDKIEKTLNVKADVVINFTLIAEPFLTEEVIVQSTRAGARVPGTYSKITKEQIADQNMGQDLPYMLNLTPSLVTSSDAGAGVGYTSFRIRGTDANRINVTVNGIPMNDAESHGVFWVNMPDFAGSVDNLQIQRGVGTSTHGSSAFGASINMQTNTVRNDAFAEITSAAGSFNTFKNSVKVGSGLLSDHFAVEARLSQISSDGFIDRAASDLKSFFVSGGYHSENALVKMNIFSGKEKTYQSWNGVPKVRLENDYEGMQRYEDHWLYTPEETKHMMESDSRTYNKYTYDNETDNYQQDHFQLFYSQNISEQLVFNSAVHYTYGRGYYEQFKKDDDLADYKIEDIVIGGETISSTDLVRQKWLSNDFYGVTASLNYKHEKFDVTIGGGANKYDGRHYGKVIWGQYLGANTPKDYEWYRNTGNKTDMNIYGKLNYSLTDNVNIYADLQYRTILYDIAGVDDDYRVLTQSHSYKFFNPKAGVFYKPTAKSEFYAFYAMGHREPNRSNLVDADPNSKQPTFETLNDFEVGYNQKSSIWSFGVNAYYMLYNDQLVLTGQINDVGSAIMINVDNSYRLGMELIGGVELLDNLTLDANLTLSNNEITNFNEYVDEYVGGSYVGQVENVLGTTDIAFSPKVIANALLKYEPVKNLTIGLSGQYVDKQYIDNSASDDRSLDAYFFSNLNLGYSLKLQKIKELRFNLMVNNVFNSMYETNAWVYSYMSDGERYAMDGYFPQAGTNFMAGVSLRF